MTAAGHGAHYLDVELESLRRKKASYGDAKIIVSVHDFYGRPERMNNLLLDLDASGCDVRKLAWMARTVRDSLEAFEILQRKSKPTIALCMGECGIISRILGKKFGAFLTYAALRKTRAQRRGK
jgi:3-dehydroquinate dehydratase type I